MLYVVIVLVVVVVVLVVWNGLNFFILVKSGAVCGVVVLGSVIVVVLSVVVIVEMVWSVESLVEGMLKVSGDEVDLGEVSGGVFYTYC